MNYLKKFLKGYLQTMLYGIEERPTYKMVDTFYFGLHLINHFQYISMIIQPFHDRYYSDFKMKYFEYFTQFFILNNMLASQLTYQLAMILLVLSFLSQVILALFISYSTIVRIWTDNLIRASNKEGNLNSELQKWVMSFNESLHWLFVLYPIIYLQVAALSLSSLTCNQSSLIPLKECSMTAGIQFLAIVPLMISYIHGQILIYIMRNHRFHETNSLKRRYSFLLLINNTLILVEILSNYLYEYEYADIIKYVFANIFAFNSIFDQLANYPYRDPVRIPSIKLAFIYWWIVVSITIYRFTELFQQSNIFFFITIPFGFWATFGEALSQNLQQYAIIEEKHLIIAIDQFYKHYLDFLKNQESQIKYFQFIMYHKINCKNPKCYSKPKRLITLDFQSKKDLHSITLSIIKCVFKSAQSWLFSMNNKNSDLKFEQLQLQYISFISETAVKPLIGYLELRTYQNRNKNSNSLYFTEITNKLANQLENQIVDHQQKMNKKSQVLKDQQNQVIEISLSQQWYTQNLYENMLQKYIQLIDMKIEHWASLINGYPSLNPFQESTQKVCEIIHDIQTQIDSQIGIPQEWFDLKTTTSKGIQIKKMSHAELNVNILTLKLYSMFYSFVLNDFDRTNYIEQYIKDLVQNDRQKEIDIIDNQSILADQTTIILVSVVKQKGKIMNKNQLALANFFQYADANDFKENVETVHQLLPKAMMSMHANLIDKFLQTGHSDYFVNKINGYYETKQGYIQKSYVKLGNLFEEKDDFVITSSILKCNLFNQIILCDQEGKIIGIGEDLFKLIQKYIPVTIDFIKDNCHIFLLFPQLLVLIKQSKTIDEYYLAEEEDHIFYLPEDLIELNSGFIREQYELLGKNANVGLESLNLSSWRSWKSKGSFRSNEGSKDDQLNIFDGSQTQFIYNFLNSHKHMLSKYSIIKSKIKMRFEKMKVKTQTFPYLIIEMDHIIEITNQSKYYNRYPSFDKVVKLTSTLYFNGVNAQRTLQDTINESIQETNYFDKITTTRPQSEFQSGSHQKVDFNQFKKDIDMINSRQMFNQESVIENNDHSQIALADKYIDINDISFQDLEKEQIKPQFQQPEIILNDDDNDLIQLDQQFVQLSKQYKMIIVDKEESLPENDELNKNSSKQDNFKNDLLQVLEEYRKQRLEGNVHEMEQEEYKKKRSIASSSRTSTSKSPFLLVRSLYSLGTFQGSIMQVVLTMSLYLILLLILVFVQMNTIQTNYDILQKNINFVTYPETLNYYFVKVGMFSWIKLYQNLKIFNYSQFINNQIDVELKTIKDEIDIQLNQIYNGIIQYEQDIISDDLKLISQITRFNIINLTNIITLSQLHRQQIQLLVLPHSMIYVFQFAQKFISLLNQNLIYCEDKIINDIVLLNGIFIAVFTTLIVYAYILISKVTQNERQILMLITRISFKSAEEIIQKLSEIKVILTEPTQLEWKKLNYFETNYENTLSELQNQILARSIKTSKLSSTIRYTKESRSSTKDKSKRSYQNNSLAQRIYDLTLTNPINYLFLFIKWFITIMFIIGTIIATITQVQDIKPTLNLNLQLIQFKLRFDSLIYQGEIIKTQLLVNQSIQNFDKSNFDDSIKIIQLFSQQFDGFQQTMADIYHTLASNSGLQSNQQQQLLIYFENSLCQYMDTQIPFCSIKVSPSSFDIPQSFIDKYGQPYPQDNNNEYISGGIILIVQELSKQIQIYFAYELNNLQLTNNDQSKQYLNSSAHVNGFIQYFLDQGKLLTNIRNNLFQQNKSKLSQATTIMALYVYIAGLCMVSNIIIYNILLVKESRLSLTMIPYDVLLEPKTLSALKSL
ncbi:hypothetical protein pb186bvf_019265 [Paramecium bursaria]